MAGKDSFPKIADDIDGWINAVDNFNVHFKELIQAIVSLWEYRHMVNEESLSKMREVVKNSCKQVCQFCNNGSQCEENDCLIRKSLEKLKNNE